MPKIVAAFSTHLITHVCAHLSRAPDTSQCSLEVGSLESNRSFLLTKKNTALHSFQIMLCKILPNGQVCGRRKKERREIVVSTHTHGAAHTEQVRSASDKRRAKRRREMGVREAHTRLCVHTSTNRTAEKTMILHTLAAGAHTYTSCNASIILACCSL